MGLGSMIFMVPHFTAEPNLMTAVNNSSSDNICRGISLREQDMGLGKYLMNCETRNAYKNISYQLLQYFTTKFSRNKILYFKGI